MEWQRQPIEFYKYHGTGNDFIMIDDRFSEFDEHNVELIAAMCHRRFGIGADGLILLRPSKEADFQMVYFNSDGRTSSMCGNGGRCIVKFAVDRGVVKSECTFVAIDGLHEAKVLENGNISLKMNDVDEVEEENGDFILNTGSPHYVKQVHQVENIDILPEAHKIRYGSRFKNAGINVNFIEIIDAGKLKIRTYERGVEDETYSCGTGVVAAAIINNKLNNNHSGSVTIASKGGDLLVTFDHIEKGYKNIWLTGPARFVYKGSYDVKME